MEWIVHKVDPLHVLRDISARVDLAGLAGGLFAGRMDGAVPHSGKPRWRTHAYIDTTTDEREIASLSRNSACCRWRTGSSRHRESMD